MEQEIIKPNPTNNKNNIGIYIISSVALIVLVVGIILFMNQNKIKNQVENLSSDVKTLKKDINAINSFEEVNTLQNIKDYAKISDSARETLATEEKTNGIGIKYAQELNKLYLYAFKYEEASNEFITSFEPDTNNDSIKNLFEDIKLESERRVDAASDLSGYSKELLRYMKEDDIFKWNENMGYLNDAQKKYDDQVDIYFDVKHEIEKIKKTSEEKLQVKQNKIKQLKAKLYFK
ncbi:hypothetical protein [Gottfriedia solisilvae]|uniref:Uncharacterized protein n=1 Tax=Gottfriedia solisilvae TaxID=1516104 RepID=A0A8J3F5K3_9BACI|nr:hypothetical protein [Gottfriedia solisilvae]GGI17991.1 hypothetical protein GCM10007380_40700 [Gottfriedia solisilvae]